MHVAHAHLDALCDAVDAVVNQLGVNSHEAIDGLVRRVDRAWGATGQAAKQVGCRAGCATLCTLWVVLGQGSRDKPAGRQAGEGQQWGSPAMLPPVPTPTLTRVIPSGPLSCTVQVGMPMVPHTTWEQQWQRQGV
jgi:hypothetical protein